MIYCSVDCPKADYTREEAITHFKGKLMATLKGKPAIPLRVPPCKYDESTIAEEGVFEMSLENSWYFAFIGEEVFSGYGLWT